MNESASQSMPARHRRILTSFATAEYYDTLDQLVESARSFVDGYLCYRDVDLSPRFYRRNARLFADRRGFGYWVWKPHVVREALLRIDDGDLVLYCDAGNLVVSTLDPLFEICAASDTGILLFDNGDHHPNGGVWRNSMWTARVCFEELGLTAPEFLHGPQVNASYIVVQKRPSAVKFIDDYQRWCERYDAVAGPRRPDRPEHPDFVEHRCDQSILSLLAIRDGVRLGRDPSEHGNDRITSGSAYPQVFNHHRSRYRLDPAMAASVHRAARGRAFLTRRVLRRANRVVWVRGNEAVALGHSEGSRGLDERPTPEVEASVIAANRDALAMVDHWIAAETREESVIGYGLPAWAVPLIDRPVGEPVTYTDLLCAVATRLRRPIRYLELGVSVGKNLFQLWHALDEAVLVGVDIESINPRLSEWLAPVSIDRVGSATGPLTVAEYTIAQKPRQHLWYIKGDEEDLRVWDELSRWTFNLVFSDAAHDPRYLRVEFDQLTARGLLDRTRGAVVWDDLHLPALRATVEGFSNALTAYLGRPPALFAATQVNGWLGSNEEPHTVGVAAWGGGVARWKSLFSRDLAQWLRVHSHGSFPASLDRRRQV
jgi:hypothetical protein